MCLASSNEPTSENAHRILGPDVDEGLQLGLGLEAGHRFGRDVAGTCDVDCVRDPLFREDLFDLDAQLLQEVLKVAVQAIGQDCRLRAVQGAMISVAMRAVQSTAFRSGASLFMINKR